LTDPIHIVIPMGGLGTRLRPHTWSKPKQLVSVAGKAVLGHVLDTFATVPEPDKIELINIVGYRGEQIETYVKENYPQIKAHFITQEDPRGQSHAIYLARQFLHGPMLMVFPDTLVETDLSFLTQETADAVAWVKPVANPRRFGVAVVGTDGWVTNLIEKPQDTSNNLAVVGFYYFKSAEALISAIEEQMRRDIQLKGEYYLVDAVNIMLERGLKMRVKMVDVWLDAGTVEALLETNHYLLEHDRDNSTLATQRSGVVVIPPVFVHPSAKIENSVIGPHASIGAECCVLGSIVRNSILEDGAQVTDVILENSLIGRQTQILRRAMVVNAGDQTVLTL
jgi:glucose-1-phosphate thymidylyltransferase